MTKLEICNKKIKEELELHDKVYKLSRKTREYIINALCEVIKEQGHYCYVEQPENIIYSDDKKEDERIECENQKLEDYINNNKNKLKGKFLFLFQNYPKNSDEYDDYRTVIEIFLLGKTYKVEMEEVEYSFKTRNYLVIHISFDCTRDHERKNKAYYWYDMRLYDTDIEDKYSKIFENLNDFIKSFKSMIKNLTTKYDNITPFD